jgi:Ca2+-transporting ATPase
VTKSPSDATTWHAASSEQLVDVLATDLRSGLKDSQVVERRAHYGPNRLAEAPHVPSWKRFVGQFAELIVWILIAAAIIAGVLGEWLDASAILAIVVLNGVLGFLQEEKAHRELSALCRRSAYSAKVVRDSKQAIVAADELVPGDLIQLEAGDHVPADSRLVESFSFGVQESALTGESVPVHKDAESVLAAKTNLADRRNMVYLGNSRRVWSRIGGCRRHGYAKLS